MKLWFGFFFFFFHFGYITVNIKHYISVCVDWLLRSKGGFMERYVTELESEGLGATAASLVFHETDVYKTH